VACTASVVDAGSSAMVLPPAVCSALPPKTWHCVVSQMSQAPELCARL